MFVSVNDKQVTGLGFTQAIGFDKVARRKSVKPVGCHYILTLNVVHYCFYAKSWNNKKVTNLLQNLAKRTFFFKVCTKLLVECFIPNFKLKMSISTSIWGAQHPNAGGNIQHLNKVNTFASLDMY